jgi:hypothetical protein
VGIRICGLHELFLYDQFAVNQCLSGELIILPVVPIRVKKVKKG